MSEEIFFHLHKFAWNSHIYLSIHYRIWTLNYPQLFSGYADVCVYGIDGDCGAIKILQCGWKPHVLRSYFTKSIVWLLQENWLLWRYLQDSWSFWAHSEGDQLCSEWLFLASVMHENYKLFVTSRLRSSPPSPRKLFLMLIFTLIVRWHAFLNKAFLLIVQKNTTLLKPISFFVIFLIMSPWRKWALAAQKHCNTTTKWNRCLKKLTGFRKILIARVFYHGF